MRYSVESLEPRYLLSGAPTPGPINLTDHTQTANSHGSASVSINQYNGTQVASALTSIIGKLSYLGQQIDKDGINNPVTQQVIPLLNETINQLTQSSTGFTLGDILFSGSTANAANTVTDLTNKIDSDFTTATANGSSPNLTSTQLAGDLQGVLQSIFGSGFTVTDNSSTGPTTGQQELDLTFAYTFNSAAIATPINLGNAAQQFDLAFSQVTAPDGPLPDAKMFTQTTVSFDLKADYSTPADTADTTSIPDALSAYQNQTGNSISTATVDADLANDLTFTPNNVQQTALISEEGSSAAAGGYLPEFGVQFGVMGAGENDSNGHVDGAYANNATFDLDVDAQLQFGAPSYSLTTLTNAEAAATTSNPYIPYTVETPVGNAATIPPGDAAISGTDALTNEATLTLPVTVYDDGQSGTGPSINNDPEFISDLGDVSGTFTVQDGSLFGATSFAAGATLPANSTPLVNAGTVELAAFARLTPSSIVSMAQNTSYLAGELDAQQLTDDLPFLNITQGNAYDFATALQNAFVNAMQSTQIVLTAANEPSTVDANFAAGDPLNLTGQTSFTIDLQTGTGSSIQGYAITVNLATDTNRSTMTQLVTDLNAALSTGLHQAGVSNYQGANQEIQAKLVTSSAGTQLLQLFSTDASAQYFLTGFTAPATGVIDLGFNQYNNVVAQVGLPVTNLSGTGSLVIGGHTIVAGDVGDYVLLNDQADSTQDGVYTVTSVSASGGGSWTLSASSASSPTISYTSTAPITVAAVGNFQLPGVIVQSSSAVALSDFTQETSFDVTATIDGTPKTVAVTIPADAYASETTLISAVQQALVTAGLWDGVTFDGVLVRGTAVGTGFGLEFYGGDDVSSLTISDPGGSSNFSALNIATTTSSTAASFELAVTSGGTTTDYTVSVNGNLTNGLLNEAQPNKTATDLVSSLQQALIQVGALNVDQTVGITVEATTNANGNPVLQFIAANPGTGSGQISSFAISNIGGALVDYLGASMLNSEHISLATSSTTPNFQTVQQLAATLYNLELNGTSLNSDGYHGILSEAPSYSDADLTSPTGTPAFTFPIDININDGDTSMLNGSQVLPDVSNVGFSFASAYDTVSGLASTSDISLSRSDNLSFDFGVNLIAPASATESLTAALPVSQLFTNYFLNSQGLIEFTPDTGVTYTVTVPANNAGDATSLTTFLAALNTAIASATASVSGAHPLTYYLANSGTALDPQYITVSSASTTLTGTGSLVIGAATLTAADIGDYIELTQQANASQNGIYVLTALSTANGGSWTLTSSTAVNPTLSYTASAAITAATESNSGDISLVVTTVGGSTRELTITIPTDSATMSQVNDAAWNDLGFMPSTTSASPYTSYNSGSGDPVTVTYNSGSATYSSANGNPITATDAVGAQANGTDAASNPDVFTTSGFITFNFPDGSTGTLEIDPIDTSGNTTAAELVQTINSQILSTASLKGTNYLALEQNADVSQYLLDVLPKVIASVNSSGQIVFSLNDALNTGVYDPAQTNAWSLTVQPDYLQENPNSLASDIGLPSSTVVDTTQPSVGLLSGSIPAPLSLSGTDTFSVSIDGQNYETVSVNLANVTSIGTLVQAINAGIVAAPNVSFHGISGTFPLSDYLKADATNGGTQVLIRLVDDGIVNNYGSTGGNANPFPVLENAAIQINSSTGPLATTLGFGSQQLFFNLQGSNGTIRNVSFSGTATEVDTGTDGAAAFSGTAAFGFTDFNVGLGLLNESAITSVTFSPSSATTINGLLIDANNGDFTSDDFGGSIDIAPSTSSYAVIRLEQLTFPTPAITGLAFGTNPSIVFGYGSYTSAGDTFGYTGPTISSFATLPAITAADVTYNNTNSMQLLAGLDLDSIVHGLERVGDLLNDWMQNGTGPFNSPLFFALQSLVNIDNFGQDFSNAIAQVLETPPTSLEATPAAILQAMQLDPSALTFAVQSTGSGSTAQVLLNISFDWAETITETLPLAVDLASLANNVSTNSTYTNLQGETEFYSSGVISQFLLGLSTVASDPVNPININFSEVSQAAVNLNIIAAQNGVAIQPEAVIQNPTSGSFFQTNYLLDGDSLSGDLPAGTGYLQLTDGSFGVDAEGLLDGDTGVLTVSTSNLTGYNSGQETISGTGAINGYTIGVNDVGSDVLLNGQSTAAQNGLYEVTSYNTSTSTWTLTEETAIADIDPMARFDVYDGNAANLYYGLAATPPAGDAASNPFVSFTASAPITIGTSNTSTAGTKVTTTLSGTGALTIDGQTLSSSDVGAYVELNAQTNASQDGVYVVSALSTTGGGSWTLTSVTFNQFSLEAPLAYDTAAATSFNPAQIDVAYATAAPVSANYTNSLVGTGSLVIGATTLTAADIGDYVDLTSQADASQDGIYVLTALSTANGGSWTLSNTTYTALTSITAAASTTLTGAGSLVIGATTLTTANIGEYIELTGQADASQNGLYTLTALSTANGGSWTLTSSTATNPTISYTATAEIIVNVPATTLTGTGSLRIGNATLTTANIGQYIELTNQANASQDGTYILTALSTANGGSWTLTDSPVTLPSISYTASSPITVATGTTTLSGSGTLSVDGHALGSGDVGHYILVNSQADPTQNGLYTVTTASGGSWKLTLSNTSVSNTRLSIQNGTVNAGLYFGYATPTQFAQLIEPAVYTYALSGAETLPYTVQAATDSALTATFTAGTVLQPATLTGTAGVSINSMSTADGALTLTGIDDVQDLTVGSLVLVKNQPSGYQDENGVYVVTALGGTDASGNPVSWVLTRASFADTVADMTGLRIDVAQGYENIDTRWIQTNDNLSALDSSANSITFSSNVTTLYSTGATPWLAFTATGQAGASLPLAIVAVTDTGTEIVIGNDLQKDGAGGVQEVTIGDLDNFYASLGTVDGTDVTLNNLPVDTTYNLVYGSFTPFKPLVFDFNLTRYFAAGGSNSVQFTSVPDLYDSYVSPSLITAFQNAFYVGDALDLALFTLQSAISEALAQEFPLVGTSLSSEADFVEDFRSQFTTLVRQNVLANPNFPLEDIDNAIYTAAYNLGLLGNLTLANGSPAQTSITEASIEVDVWNGSSFTPFPFGQFTNKAYYGENSNGTYYEQVPVTTSSITFAFNLTEDYASQYTTTLSAVDLGDSAIGATISTDTSNYTTGTGQTGGVLLQRKFVLNFGFGINTTAGFFVFNPTEASGFGLQAAPMVDFGFMAELDGNINDPTTTIDGQTMVQPFFQDSYASELNGLSVEVADGRLLDQLDNESSTGANLNGADNDNLPSGFYGDVLFDLNFNHTTATAPASLSFLNGRYADVEDLRATPEVGNDATYGSSINPDTDVPDNLTNEPSLPAGSLFNFLINADADVDLTVQSQVNGLVPAIQADLIYDKSYGAGAIGFGLVWNNAAVVGLGNAALGTEEMNDQATVGNASSTAAQINAAVADFNTIATKVSPIWRFLDRDQVDSLLLINGGQGNTFVDYQNIELNLIDYLGNTLNNALKLYEEVVAPLQPYINFLNTPIPGTTAFLDGGIVLGLVMGGGFGTFIAAVEGLNALLAPLATLAAEDTTGAGWMPAFLSPTEVNSDFPGEQYLGGSIPDKQAEALGLKTQKYNTDLAKQKQQNSTENTAGNSSSTKTPLTEDTSSSNSAAEAAAVSNNASSAGSDSTSENFDKTKSGGTTSGTQDADSNKGSTKSSSGETVKPPRAISGGISGGDILFDALDYNTLANILQGINTPLLRIQLPTLSINYTFIKIFPVPAFPPALITLGLTIQFDVTINMGWDTEGFFMNTVDLKTGLPTPLFDFSATFSAGVGLSFGIVVVDISLFFQVKVNFDWNDVSGTGEMHNSDFNYLTSHGDSIFAINITGTLGFNFNISLMIPIPIIGPILISLFSYTFSIELFNVTFLAVTGQMQLGTVENGDVLLLNSGVYASQRLFDNTSPVNEDFTLYDIGGNATSGENILVDFDNEYYQEFNGIKQVIGYLGSGSSEIDAGATLDNSSGTVVDVIGIGYTSFTNLNPLQYAVEDFFGGSGDTVLIGGAGYNSAWGTSRLQGGTGTGTELLETNAQFAGARNPGFDIIAGGGPAIIIGTTTGGDTIVAGQGPDLIYGASNDNFYFESGFGNDRLYVTGGNNAVSFDGWTLDTNTGTTTSTVGNVTTVGDSLLTAAQVAQFITPLTVAAITTPITFSFGQLVESAVTGNSTVFFATDPAEVQQISNWTGGVGGDTYNIYYFAPQQTLILNAPEPSSSSRVNTFNIYFGNPNIVYYHSPTQNQGTIDLNDTNSGDVLNIDQTFPETVNNAAGAPGYGAAYDNGREVLNYDTNLLINYNAPNSTIILGSTADQTDLDFDPINAAYYNVGTIVLVSPIEFESSNVVIKVKNTLDLLYDVSIVGSTGTSGAAPAASLEIDITNAFPTGESDLTFEPGAVLGINATSEANNPESDATWKGDGTITLNINSGSVKDVNVGGNGVGGLISVINGTLVISALTSIGSPTDIFNILAGQFVAQTTSLNDVSNQNGIYVQSAANLHITAAGSINGLSTADGAIYVDVKGGNTLYYYQIDAGSGSIPGNVGSGFSAPGSVTLVADCIQPGGQFSYTVDLPTREPVTIEIVTIVPTFNLVDYELDVLFGEVSLPSFLPLFVSYSIQVVDLVVGYQVENKPTTVLVGGTTGTGNSPLIKNNIDSISGTNTLSFWNDSNGSNITVGTPSTGSPSGLYISDTILNEIQPGFSAIVFGRNSTDATFTGEVIVNASTFDQSPNVIFQGSSINVNGSVTNDYAAAGSPDVIPDSQLQFITYGTGHGVILNGHLTFGSGVEVIAGTINISTVANLTLSGTFLSEDSLAGTAGRAALANGLIQVTSTGTVTLAADTYLLAAYGQSSISISGTAVTVDPTDSLYATDNLTLIASAGMVSETAAATPNRLRAANLIVQAATGIDLLTDVANILEAATNTGDVVLDNNSSLEATGATVNVDSITTSIGNGVTSAGTITLTNVGDIDFVRALGVTAPVIQTNTVAGSGVILTSTSGVINGDSNYNVTNDDIETNALSLNAAGTIGSAVSSTLSDSSSIFALVTQASSLTAASTTGTITIANVGAVSLGAVSAPEGTVSIFGTDDINVLGAVSTGGGNILIDNHRLAANKGSILIGQLTPTPVIAGTIDAGTGTVTVTADNGILGALGENLLTGSSVTLTAWGDETTHAAATALIDVKLDTTTVDAVAEQVGKIVLDTNNNLLLHNVQTPLGGDIDVTAESATLSGTGSLVIGATTLTSADIGDYIELANQANAAQNGTYILTALSTASGGSWTLTSSTAANPALSFTATTPISGTFAEAAAQTGPAVNLVTYDLDAYSSNVNLAATGTITDDTTDVTSLTGAGSLTLGGHTFTSADEGLYVLLNDQTPSNQNGIYLVSAVSTTGGGSWTLTASTAGNPTISYTSTGPLVSTANVTNDIVGATLTTLSVGNTVLKTDIANLDAAVGGAVAGTLTVNQDSGFEVNSATTYDGSITITAGINSNYGILAAGFINVGDITAGDGLLGDISTINLTAIGAYIQDPTFGDLVDTSMVTGGTLTATTQTGIHGLNTTISTLDATSSAQGATFTIDQTGNIDIDDVDMIVGGGTAGGNFTLTASSGNGTAGAITVNDITTDTVNSTVTLTSNNSDIVQTTGDIIANALVAQADTGITLLTSVLTIQSAITTTGNITITNDNSADANSGAGALQIDLMQARAAAGIITLTNYGDINFHQTSPQATIISTGASGAVHLTSTYGGIFGDTIYTAVNGAVDIETGTLSLQTDANINNLHLTDVPAWIYGLVTEATSLSANSTTGTIAILNISAATFTDVETQEKSIALYDTGTVTVAGNVTSNNVGGSTAGTLLIDTHTFAQLGGSIDLGVSGGAGGYVNAGAATVTLLADNGIFGALGLNLITGSYVTMKAYGDASGPLSATVPLIEVKLDTPTVDANTYANGKIVLDTNDNILLDDVNSYAGDIIVTAEAAVTHGPGINIQTDVVNAGSSDPDTFDVHLTADGTITDSSSTAALNDSRAGHNITANHLYAQSVGDSVLKTDINYLTAYVGNLVDDTGSLLVNQDKALTVISAVTTDGTITMNTGLVNDAGNIFLGIITAGGTSAIDLNALGGYVTDPNYDPTATGPNANDNSLVTGGVLTITAPLGVLGIETQVTQFDITCVGPNASVTIDQQGNVIVDDIDLSATGGEITLTTHPFTGFGDGTMTVNDITTDTITSAINLTSSGAINQELDHSDAQIGKITGATLNAVAVTGIDILTDINLLNATIVPNSAGNIIVTQDHTLTIGQVQTPSGAFDLTLVAGAIIASVQALVIPYNVEANEIDLILPDAVAAANQTLNVYADQLDVNVTTGGGIYIDNFKSHSGAQAFVADKVYDVTGTVVLSTVGNLLANDVEITDDVKGNDMVFTTTGGGNVVLNFVGTGLTAPTVIGQTPPSFGDLFITSDGMINAVDPATALKSYQGTAINIVAANVNFNAQTGIGEPASLAPEMTASSLTAKTVTGDINIGVSSSSNFEINGYATAMGNLGFVMSGGGNLYATGFSTLDGNVGITVQDKATLFLGTVVAIGNVDLTMDHVQFVGGPASIYGTGDLVIQPDSATQFVQIDSYFAQTVYEQENTLEIGTTGFQAFLTHFQSIVIGNPGDNNTYVYYYYLDPYTEGNADGAPLSETTINFTYLESNNAAPTEFQLADLYSDLADQAEQGQLTAGDIQDILDELGLSGDFSSSSFDDSGDGGDYDGLTAAGPAPTAEIVTVDAPSAEASQVVGSSAPSALHQKAATVAEHDDSSWIDQAVVVTAATTISTKPLRRFSKLFR